MRKLLFIVAFLFVGVSFADSDSLGVNSSKDTTSYKIMNGLGKESKIDSVLRIDGEVVIFIDGIKIPAIQNRETMPLPFPKPVIKDTAVTPDTSVSALPGDKAVKNASVNGGFRLINYLIGALLCLLVVGIVYGISKKRKAGEDGIPETVAPDNTLNPADPTAVAPEPDNRFVPVVDVNHAPVFETPNREELNPTELPNMLQIAYQRQNVSGNLGRIDQILETKFGRLNGVFIMEHADGTRSIQQFNNELGVKARVRFTGGSEATVYSRYSCLNNLRAPFVSQITQQPTFIEEPRIEQVGSATVTTQFQPEPVPSEIVEVPVVEIPEVPAPEVVTAPAVPAEPAPMLTLADDDPITTVTINGKEISAPLSVVKELLK